MRRGALLKEAQFMGRLPTSVAGGDVDEGNWLAIAWLCGPGSVTLARFFAFIAPCGGASGLPNVAACAVVAVIAAPAAVAANSSRLDIMADCSLGKNAPRPRGDDMNAASVHCGLTKTGIDLAAG